MSIARFLKAFRHGYERLCRDTQCGFRLISIGLLLEIWTLLDWPTNAERICDRSCANKIGTIAALSLWCIGMAALWRSSDSDLVSPVYVCSTLASYMCHLFEIGKRETLALIMTVQLTVAILHVTVRRLQGEPSWQGSGRDGGSKKAQQKTR